MYVTIYTTVPVCRLLFHTQYACNAAELMVLVPTTRKIQHHWITDRKQEEMLATLYTSKFSIMESKQEYRSFKSSTT